MAALTGSASGRADVATDVVIVGGGISGVLAARRCHDAGWPYVIIERDDDFGGIWAHLANKHSDLQASQGVRLGVGWGGGGPRLAPARLPNSEPSPLGLLELRGRGRPPPCRPPTAQVWEPLYRWDDRYKLEKDPFSKVGTVPILYQMRQFAHDLGCYHHAKLGHELHTIREEKDGRWAGGVGGWVG